MAAPSLAYTLPEFGLTIPFRPTDFTQVNQDDQRALVSRALRLLAPGPEDVVIDWFCGLGNFTLPLATRAARGARRRGQRTLSSSGRTSAASANGLAGKTRFVVRDLFELDAADLAAFGERRQAGCSTRRAKARSRSSRRWSNCSLRPKPTQAGAPPERIVYVSCNPATLARDAGLLVHRAGYRCAAAGVVNMFPHTAHVESIALFERAAD